MGGGTSVSALVTGGGGFLGKPVIRMLDELGAEPRAVRSAEHDLRDADACRAALGDAAASRGFASARAGESFLALPGATRAVTAAADTSSRPAGWTFFAWPGATSTSTFFAWPGATST